MQNTIEDEAGFSDIDLSVMLLLIIAAVGVLALAIAMSTAGGLPELL